MKKITTLVVICLLTYSCKYFRKQTPEERHQELLDSKTAYFKEIIPNKKHPKFKPLVEAFKKQEHRFEFDKCQYRYNDKPFFLGDSPKDIIAIFGKPDEIMQSDDKEFTYYDYKQLKVSMFFLTETMKLKGFNLRIATSEGHEDTPYDIVLFREMPYHLDMGLKEFLKFSNISITDLARGGWVFHLVQKECPPTKDTRIYIEIAATAAYHNTSAGHFTWSGPFDPEGSEGPIRGFSFIAETLEELRK